MVALIMRLDSDFGGYIDIVCDFTIYALIPIAMALQRNTRSALLLVTALEAVYFVNCVSQFYLASLLEKRAVGAKATGTLFSPSLSLSLLSCAVVCIQSLPFPSRNDLPLSLRPSRNLTYSLETTFLQRLAAIVR